MYQQIRVPRPGTWTLIRRGSLKRKSSAQTSNLGSSRGDASDFTSRSLKVVVCAEADVRCRAAATTPAARRARVGRHQGLCEFAFMTSPSSVYGSEREPSPALRIPFPDTTDD